MNWKWEDKVDNAREKQRLFEEQKRRELAEAKSADALQRIQRNAGIPPSLQEITTQAQRAEREYMEVHRQMMVEQMRRQMVSPPQLAGIFGFGYDEPAELSKPKPLPEEHIVAAITGYRAWNVPLFVDELRSVAKASKWKPYRRFEAICKKTQCEGVSCQCGIYAFNKMELVQKEYTMADRSKRYVYGECSLWGRVLECKDGYRAQFAYPKAFINNGAIAKRMAEVFGVKLLTTS